MYVLKNERIFFQNLGRELMAESEVRQYGRTTEMLYIFCSEIIYAVKAQVELKLADTIVDNKNGFFK